MYDKNGLIAHGIFQDKSKFRIHVCFEAQCVYVFETQKAIEEVEAGRYIPVPAYQPGYDKPTAMGYLVPPQRIEGVQRFDFPVRFPSQKIVKIKRRTCGSKGRFSEMLVRRLFHLGEINLPIMPNSITDTALQIDGLDLQLNLDDAIQVKCDFDGGEKHLGGTGNLFIQFSEINPHGMH